MTGVQTFAVTGRGLEAVCAEEMALLPGVQVTGISYRRVSALCSGSLLPLLSLKTVDDIFLFADTWQGIVPQRSALEGIKDRSARLHLAPLFGTLSLVRPLPSRPVCSVTVSFVGKRNYSWMEIRQAVIEGLQSSQPYRFAEESGSQINLRLFIEHDTAYVGVRMAERAIHQRPYKVAHLEGSLKPSVAAALVHLAKTRAGDLLLDPFCGAGTVVIEAAHMGAVAVGSDLDPQALAAAQANSTAAGTTPRFLRTDARQLPFASRSVPIVVSNLPWGRQIQVDEELAQFYSHTGRELQRILLPGGRLVLLTNAPQLVKFGTFHLEMQLEISLFGQTPTILVLQLPH